jgi:hypothetical protein
MNPKYHTILLSEELLRLQMELKEIKAATETRTYRKETEGIKHPDKKANARISDSFSMLHKYSCSSPNIESRITASYRH